MSKAQTTEQLIEEAVERFEEWFSQFTKPYEEYEKNKERLWEMLGVVGEKEAPMEVVARLQEIKRLRKVEYLFKNQFLIEELSTIASKSAESGKEQGLKDSLVLAYDLADKNGLLDYGKLYRKVEQALSKGTK